MLWLNGPANPDSGQGDLDHELAFIHDCRAVLEQRTVILITHRPASLALADRVLQLRHGRVIETQGPASPDTPLE